MPSCFQRRYKSRGCNVAECGGSTSVCTSTQTTSESCNTGCCRKFYDQTKQNRHFWTDIWRWLKKKKFFSLKYLIQSKLWTRPGRVGAPGAAAAKHVEVGWDLLNYAYNLILYTKISKYESDREQRMPFWLHNMSKYLLSVAVQI